MKEERMKILQMLSEGKITTEEAEKLLSVSENHSKELSMEKNNKVSNSDKFLYVNVEPKEGKKSERVNIKVPFALLKAGLNITGLVPKEAQDKINSKMHEKGMNFDFSDVKPENIQGLMDSLEQFTVDVDTEESIVKIFCK